MDVSPFSTIQPAPAAVFARAKTTPDRPRFFHRAPGGAWQAVSWDEFARRIRKVALHLVSRGLRPGQPVCLFASNSVDWAVAALAIQTAGGVMVPIYASSTAEQAGYVIDHSGAELVFVDAATSARCAGFRGALALGGEAWDQADDPERAEAMLEAISLDAPGLMLYTSGTSGHPKGVPLTHRNVGVNARDWLEINAPLVEEGDVDLLWLPMSHIFGLGELCLGNTLGFTSYLCRPDEVLALMPEVRPMVFMSVPAYWEKLSLAADIAATSGGRLRFCLSGGAGLDRAVKDKLLAAGLVVLEGYGLTEASPTLTLNRPGDFRFDSVGKPLPSVELRLADDGEILARGPNIFSGYHRDPEATAAAFTEDGWLKTGDIGQFTEDGFLQIVDRKKDILVTAGGKNIPPANIELRFRGDDVIEHVVVYGDGKRYLVAGVWLRAEHAARPASEVRAQVQARIDAVNARLASCETIKKFTLVTEPLTVDAGMMTQSLKLRRKAIYARFRDQFEALYA